MKPNTSIITLLLLLAVVDVGFGVHVTLIVPKELYYDSYAVASVSAFHVQPNTRETVKLEYRGVKNNGTIINSTELEFSSDGSQTWNVMFTWSHLLSLEEKCVQLVMSFNSQTTSKELKFANNFGYIFIQTDKPIYTPQQTVKYRVLAVDEQQKLSKYKIKIDIKNHKQVIFDRNRTTADDAFKAHEFKLPKETPPGNWSITANFEGVDPMPGSAHTVTFEVKEYILPRFYTNVEVFPKVITRSTETINVTITAMYFYGKNVVGTADLQLGTWHKYKGTQLFPKRYNVARVKDSFIQILRVDKLFPMFQEFPMDKRLYVKATVTERTTLMNDTFEDTSTYFSNAEYSVDFNRSKMYFRPGFNYTLQVLHNDGRPASSIYICLESHFFNKWNQQFAVAVNVYKLNDQGRLTKDDIYVPEGTNMMSFLVTFGNQMEATTCSQTEPKVFNATKYISSGNEYLNIFLRDPIRSDEDGLLHLNYTQRGGKDKDVSQIQDSITILVLAKGRIVFNTKANRTKGGTYVILPSSLYPETIPRMRIIAYYVSTSSKYVIDSLVAYSQEGCIEEISFRTPLDRHRYKPKDRYNLTIRGTPGTRVGLLAVDSAILHLNKNQTLTRSLMLTQLDSHDKGTANGDGSNMEEILSNSGLYYLSLKVDTRVKSKTNYAMNVMHDYFRRSRQPNFSGVGESHREFKRENTNKMAKVAVQPQTIRSDFPESWLFNEILLTSKSTIEEITLPDSITTWSFLAVGLSSNRGVCVSESLEQPVVKLFFAELLLPNKVKRLEEVDVTIIIYNYHLYNLTVDGTVKGSKELCFLSNTADSFNEAAINFELYIQSMDSKSITFKVIPLQNGKLTVKVEVKSKHHHDVHDTVEKKMNVFAEGQKVKKSITFVLDPEGKHVPLDFARSREITFSDSVAVNNMYDIKNKKQQTTINLALPVEVIKGSESCRIFAFGDLMGDIINNYVVELRNLVDTPFLDAEEVLGDLAPTIYALQYANSSGLIDNDLRERGRKFIKHGVARLLMYMLDNNSFGVTPESEPATWLTAFALKTLCQASLLTSVDHENLTDKGFDWLFGQLNTNKTLNERDWRLAKDSFEYRIMLSAEVLIALLECKKTDKDDHLTLQGALSTFLQENVKSIKEPMVLAKVTYALMLDDDKSDEYKDALKKLQSIKRKNKQGHLYWSNMVETDETPQTPFWYHKGAQASAIEATAYALIIYLNHEDPNADPNADDIADWLVGQRNDNGAFIGAMDSTVAIQALSAYSFKKHGVEVDLHCNVSSDRLKEFLHSFKFTEENATHPKSLNNVPVGQVLDVLTTGQGLGQMQVNVEYNIPIEKNKHCPFHIIPKTTNTKVPVPGNPDRSKFCSSSCEIGCQNDRITKQVIVSIRTIKIMQECKKRGPPFSESTMCKRVKSKQRSTVRKNKPTDVVLKRKHRNVHDNQAISKKSICINICLQKKKAGESGPTEVQIEMLTGYQPVAEDIVKINGMLDVKQAVYDNFTEVLRVQFTSISCKKKTCLTFRALTSESVSRLMPAIIQVKKIGTAASQCVVDYYPPVKEVSLQMFCSNFNNSNKGQCKCLSGLCSKCKPVTESDATLSTVKDLVCKSKIAYKLQFNNVTNVENWSEIDATVIALNRTGIDNITVGTSIKMTTPSFCSCTAHYKNSSSAHFKNNSSEGVYLIAGDVEKFVDIKGKQMYRYILDDTSTFLKVAEKGITNSSKLVVQHFQLHDALANKDKCHN